MTGLDLYPRWEALCVRAGMLIGTRPAYQVLAAIYSEKWRTCHTFPLVAYYLAEFEKIRSQAKEPDAIEFAVWLARVVNDPREEVNIEMSGIYAQQFLVKSGADESFAFRVAKLIFGLRSHEGAQTDDEQLFMDIDLSILGQSWPLFAGFEEKYRKEYQQIPDREFTRKRQATLRGLCLRPKLFVTESLHVRYEERARKNMLLRVRELETGIQVPQAYRTAL